MVRFARALRRACPRCGHSPVFVSFYEMDEACPSCDLTFGREPGYWVGAMIINTIVISFVFLATMGLGIGLFWPDVPWGWLTVTVITLAVVVPVFFYPISKTLWLALDLAFRGSVGEEQ